MDWARRCATGWRRRRGRSKRTGKSKGAKCGGPSTAQRTMKPSDASVGMTASLLWLRSGGGGELGCEGVERERAEQIAAEAGVDLVDGVAGALDPGEGAGRGPADARRGGGEGAGAF